MDANVYFSSYGADTVQIHHSVDCMAKFQEAISGSFQQMTVGMNDGVGTVQRIVDTSVRSAEISNKLYDFGAITVSGLPDGKTMTIDSNFEFLRYSPGDHFAPHTDRTRSSDHSHTICMYPPQNVVGGELILEANKTTNHAMSPDAWIVVIFPTDMTHSSQPIVQGTKYVFKGTCSTFTEIHRPYGTARIRYGYED
jgi:hypothetical protein